MIYRNNTEITLSSFVAPSLDLKYNTKIKQTILKNIANEDITVSITYISIYYSFNSLSISLLSFSI